MSSNAAAARPWAKAGPEVPLPAWVTGPAGVIAVFALYASVHALLRLTASPNLPQDDVMAVLYSQTLELGYSLRQPPLYDWMLWGVERLTGPTLAGFLLLKYALLTATGLFVYLAGLRIYRDRAWAALAAFSLLLLYQIGWNIHEGVTHTAAMICAIAATFWAFTRLVEERAWRDYALFGLALGLGALTKYGFPVFAAILLVAALPQPAMRARLLTGRMAAALALAGAIAAPFALWLAFHDHDLAGLYGQTLSSGAAPYWQKAGRGVFLALRSTLTFLSPLILLVPLIFTGALAAMGAGLAEALRPTRDLDWEKLLLQMALAALLLMLAAALFTGAANFRMRYMHPFYLLTPLWLIAMARRGQRRAWQPALFIAVSLLLAGVVLGLRAGNLYIGEPPFCSKCREMIPYAPLADALREHGFQAGTIIAGYRHTAGNMRRLFPQARVVALRRPRVVPPIRPGDREGQVAVVWDPRSEGEGLPKGAAQQVAALGGSLAGREPLTVRVPWTHLWRATGYRHSEWKLIVIDLARQ